MNLCLSYVLFAEQLQVVSLWGAADSPLSLHHLQLVDQSSLVAPFRCCRVHLELLHPDNTPSQPVNPETLPAAEVPDELKELEHACD